MQSTYIEPTPLADIPEGSTYELTLPDMYGRPRYGRVERQGAGSVTVHQPRVEGDGWERTSIAKGTRVFPCEKEQYFNQGFGNPDASSRVRNKSEVKNPVDFVWELCDDMIGRGIKPTVEDRDRMVEAAVEAGVNMSTAKTQYYAWRKKYAAR